MLVHYSCSRCATQIEGRGDEVDIEVAEHERANPGHLMLCRIYDEEGSY